MPLFLLLLIIPAIETFVIIKVANVIGGWTAFGLVILSAILGSHLLRQQGMAKLQAFRQMQMGGVPIMPAESLLDGVVILVSGILLMTPGFITSSFGLLMLLPNIRKAFVQKLMASGSVHVQTSQPQNPFEEAIRQAQRHQSVQDDEQIHDPFDKPLGSGQQHHGKQRQPHQGIIIDGEAEEKSNKW